MGAILAIALNTFREAVRDRILYILLLFAIGIVLFSLVLGSIAPNEQTRLTTDVGLAGISFMTVVLAVVLGVTNLRKEIERKTVYFILPMPLARWQFLVGKFVGMCWVLAVSLVIMGGTLLTVLAWYVRDLQEWIVLILAGEVALAVVLFFALRKHPHLWPTILAASVFGSGLAIATVAEANVQLVLQAMVLIITEAVVLTSVALLFSAFSTPLLAGTLTFLVFVAGRALTWLDQLAARMDSELAGAVAGVAGVAFPNCYLFAPSANVLEGRLVLTAMPMAAWELVSHATSYGLTYAAMTLILAGIILWRRDFV